MPGSVPRFALLPVWPRSWSGSRPSWPVAPARGRIRTPADGRGLSFIIRKCVPYSMYPWNRNGEKSSGWSVLLVINGTVKQHKYCVPNLVSGILA